MLDSLRLRLAAIQAESLLALGGALIFFVAFISLWTLHERRAHAACDDSTPFSLWGSSPFTIGQYYFNSTESINGPYDLCKAQLYYERAIAQDPQGNKYQWYQSGRIDFINGNFDKALYKFSMQQHYFKDQVPNVYYMIGLTYGYKARLNSNPDDWVRAETAMQKAVDYFYEAAWPRVDLAWLYFSEGKYEAMKPVIEEGFPYHANNPWLLNMYGLALLNTGDKAMAKEYFNFALELTEKMDAQEWGKSYPGNNPQSWDIGLSQFKQVLQENINLSEK